MVFSSLIFLFAYLPVTLAAYFLTPFKYRNLVLFLVSLVFYAWGEPSLIILMLISIATAYGFGFPIRKYRDTDQKKAKLFLTLSLLTNLSFLIYFKYFNFILTNLSLIPFLSFIKPIENLSLPVGISFYTFQIMSYSIDLYRGETDVQKKFVSFGAYVTLFPQLIAGPIVRYRDVDDQLMVRKETLEKFSRGVRTFLAGLSKKVLLANSAGAASTYFAEVLKNESTVLTGWLVAIFYTFQIYFDFSGYSDMAIGLGRMFGFEFLENFNYPYISKSITEFWRRWHISLSTWFREYVYYPLGGNRKGTLKTYRNIAIVWLTTGIWHGAAWNYIIWGAYFCVLLIIEKLFLLKALEKLPNFFRHCYALIFIVIGWIIFDPQSGIECFKASVGSGVTSFASSDTVYTLIRSIPFLAICVIASTPYPKKAFNSLYEKSDKFKLVVPILCGISLLLCVAYLVSSSFNPFIYYIF